MTPLFCVWFLKVPKTGAQDPYSRPMYRLYRRVLHMALRLRWLMVLMVNRVAW